MRPLMKRSIPLLAAAVGLALVPLAWAARAQDQLPGPVPVGSMSELMVDFIYPASDAVFYIESRLPDSPEAWNALVAQTLMLAESGNLLMAPGRAYDQDQWIRDALLLRDSGAAAYRAAKERDLAGLLAVSDALYESCTTCHTHYRPNFRGGE